MTTTTHGILTVRDATALADLIRAAQGNAPVTRLMGGEHVVTGTARSVGHEDFTFARPEDDVRDLFLRVTLRSGTEAAWPIRELLADYHANTLALNYSAE